MAFKIQSSVTCFTLKETLISTGKFSVCSYETVAQTSHINQGIFENVLKNTEKIH